MREVPFGAKRSGRFVRSQLCALVCGAAIALAPASALAGAGTIAKEAGIGAGSALASLVYAPVKLCYATFGLIVSGMAWGFSGGDAEVAKTVLTPSVLGDYVITPSQLRGEEGIEFFGREPGYGEESTSVASAPDDWPEEGW